MKLDSAGLVEIFINRCEGLVGQGMDGEDRAFTQKHFKPAVISKNDFFVRAGDVPEYLAFTMSGLLRCFAIDLRGREITKYFCEEGSFCSSYGALVRRRESGMFIQALEDSLLLKARYRDVADTVGESPFFLRLMHEYMEKILLYKEEREEDLLRLTARERYARFLEQSPRLEPRVHNEHIATYLGITPESLSRIRKTMRELPNDK